MQSTINSKEKQNKIPINLALNLLGDEIVNKNTVAIEPFDFIIVANNEIFIIEVHRPQGGYTSTYFMLSFIDKILNQAKIIGYNALNIDGGYYCQLKMVNDSILETRQEEIKYDPDGEKIATQTEYTYYLINKNGFDSIQIIEPSKARLYPRASNKILEISELKKMKKSDLDIMRNEIFADHGYIFKTEKWNNYFSRKDWYNPRYEDVTNMLTIIEKINIERILKKSDNQ